MLPFAYEPIERMRERLPAALARVISVKYAAKHPEERPGNNRRNIFDWEHGVRLFVSRDQLTRGATIRAHFSMSIYGEREKEVADAVCQSAPPGASQRVHIWATKMRDQMAWHLRELGLEVETVPEWVTVSPELFEDPKASIVYLTDNGTLHWQWPAQKSHELLLKLKF